MSKPEDGGPEYSKRFYCHNCGESFIKYFKFGSVASKGACPDCGVTDSQLRYEGMRNDISLKAGGE